MKSKRTTKWYNQRGWALVLAFVALVAAYLIGLHSLDTGSWQQYGMAFVLLVFGLNRLFRTVWPKKEA